MPFRSDHEALRHRVDTLVDEVRDRDREIASLRSGRRWSAQAKWRALVIGLAGLAVALTIVAAWVWRPTGPPPEQRVRRWAPPHAPVERAAPLLVGDRDGDGVQEFVGRFDGDAPAGRYIGLFDGKSRRLQWRLGPYDSLREPRHVAFSGDRLAIVDGASVALHSLDDGRVVHRREVGGEVVDVCSPPDRKGAFWLMVAGDGHGLLHPDDGTFMAMPIPTWCEERAVTTAPPIEGYRTAVALVEGDAMVALAEGGPKGPALLGFRVGDRATRWSRPVATDAPTMVARAPKPGEHAVLHGGRLFIAAFHRGSNKTRLEALDAATGESLWQVETPHDAGDTARAMVVGDRQLLLAHDTMLSVFDLATGEHLATLGAP